MKILSPFSAILIALQITTSFSAPVSTHTGPDLVEGQSQTSAQGDCTSQSVTGQPATVSGECGQGNTGGTYTSGGTPPAVGSGNRNTTSGGGTTGTSGGTLTGNTGGTTTGSRYGTTGSGHATKGSEGVSGGTIGNTGGTTTGNRYATTGSGHGTDGSGSTTTGHRNATTGSGHGMDGSDGASNTKSLESAGNAASPPPDKFAKKLKGESPGNVALPQLDEIFSNIPNEVSDGGNPGIDTEDVTATTSRKRDLDNQADNSML